MQSEDQSEEGRKEAEDRCHSSRVEVRPEAEPGFASQLLLSREEL
jgi:hypothetical protein